MHQTKQAAHPCSKQQVYVQLWDSLTRLSLIFSAAGPGSRVALQIPLLHNSVCGFSLTLIYIGHPKAGAGSVRGVNVTS